MNLITKLRLFFFGEPDFDSEVSSLRWHYENHLYLPMHFKEYFEGNYTICIRERLNEHGAIVQGIYRCTREQLLAAHKAKNLDWPISERIAVVDFMVMRDCTLAVQFFEVGEEVP